MTAETIVAMGGLITAIGGVIALLIKTANDNKKSNNENNLNVKGQLAELEANLIEALDTRFDEFKSQNCDVKHKPSTHSESHEKLMYDTVQQLSVTFKGLHAIILQPYTINDPQVLYCMYAAEAYGIKSLKGLQVEISLVKDDYENALANTFTYIPDVSVINNTLLQGIYGRSSVKSIYIHTMRNARRKFVGFIMITNDEQFTIHEDRAKDILKEYASRIQDVIQQHEIEPITKL